MRRSHIFSLFSVKVVVLSILYCCCSCSSSDRGNLPVLDLEKSGKGMIEIDNKFRNFTHTHSNFLQYSSGLSPNDIRNIHCYGNDLYVLFSNKLLYYDLISGDLLYSYQSPVSADFVDFGFDPLRQRAYILDKKQSHVFELQVKGDVIKEIKLDSAYAYTMIKQLDQGCFLIPKQTAPYPSYLTVDFTTGEVKDYTLKDQKKTYPIPEGSDSIWVKYPLYVANETRQGVKLKYLFDDQVYLFTKDGVTPEYIIDMGKHKVKRKYFWSKSTLKNNNRFRVLKFWHGKERTYILHRCIIKNIFGVFDPRMLSQFKDHKSYNSYGGMSLQNGISTMTNQLFMDDECRRFICFKNLNDEERRGELLWPQHMQGAAKKDNLVLSVFYMK
ncbi:hypothetical protein EYV94_25115 [Puteibacter caeruleilacunae]|nr:hypothetical protein EYV94_25115 [Puteibacter caeruleilacunae]